MNCNARKFINYFLCQTNCKFPISKTHYLTGCDVNTFTNLACVENTLTNFTCNLKNNLSCCLKNTGFLKR